MAAGCSPNFGHADRKPGIQQQVSVIFHLGGREPHSRNFRSRACDSRYLQSFRYGTCIREVRLIIPSHMEQKQHFISMLPFHFQENHPDTSFFFHGDTYFLYKHGLNGMDTSGKTIPLLFVALPGIAINNSQIYMKSHISVSFYVKLWFPFLDLQ